RGRDAGRGAGDRQRPGDRDRRHAGPLRAERLRPADRAQPARLDQAARQRVAALRRQVRRRDRGEPRELRALRGADALRRDGAQPVHRLRQGDRDRQGRSVIGTFPPRGRARGGRGRVRAGRGPGLPSHGQAARHYALTFTAARYVRTPYRTAATYLPGAAPMSAAFVKTSVRRTATITWHVTP